MKQHKLHPGHVYVTDQSTRIWASLGAGTVVCLWDHHGGRGGMAYFTMPETGVSSEYTPHYGNVAITTLISELLQAGSRLENLEAHIVTVADKNDCLSADDTNLQAATDLLLSYGIEISSKITKKVRGKILSFYVESGLIEIKDAIHQNDGSDPIELKNVLWAEQTQEA